MTKADTNNHQPGERILPPFTPQENRLDDDIDEWMGQGGIIRARIAERRRQLQQQLRELDELDAKAADHIGQLHQIRQAVAQ